MMHDSQYIKFTSFDINYNNVCILTQLGQVEDGQDDSGLIELSTSGDLPVKKLAETAITKLI